MPDEDPDESLSCCIWHASRILGTSLLSLLQKYGSLIGLLSSHSFPHISQFSSPFRRTVRLFSGLSDEDEIPALVAGKLDVGVLRRLVRVDHDRPANLVEELGGVQHARIVL